MRSLPFALYLLAAALCSGCSDGSDGSDEIGNSGADDDGGSDSATVTGGIDLDAGWSGGDPPTVGVGDSGSGCGSLEVSDGCTGEVFEGEGIPLDIQVIFDQSGSMATVIDEATGETRMDAVVRAVEAFVTDSQSVGLGVGVSFFGYQPIGATSCDPDDYDSAAVSIELLPDNAADLLTALRGAPPTGETPTHAAIVGGCRISSAHHAEHPGRAVVNLLVTDGEPKAPVTSKSTDCNPTLADAVAAAKACLDEGAGVATYVLGVGPSLDNLNQIAAAGGTQHAYLVADDTSSGVLEALNQVRATAQIPCELPMDTNAGVHYDQTTVVTQSGDCTLTHLVKVASAESCADGGFYFDDSENPTSILLCESTCGQVKQPGTKLLYSIGCGIEVVK